MPGDPSSAAFFMVAALIVPGSDVTIENVGLNPTRAGLLEVLRQMGGNIEELNPREVGGEPVADLRVRHSPLQGHRSRSRPRAQHDRRIPGPVRRRRAGGRPHGHQRARRIARQGIGSPLRHGRRAHRRRSARWRRREDGLIIDGTGGEPLRGSANSRTKTHLDHRIAMSMAVAGLASRDGVEIDDTRPIATSFPAFEALLDQLEERE